MKKKKGWNGRHPKQDGSAGGKSTASKYGRDYMSILGKRGRKKQLET